MARTKTRKSEFVTLPLDKIKPYKNNPRHIDAEAVNDVARTITNVGYISRIVVDEKNVILVGHKRLRALYQLEYDEAEVHRITGLTAAQKRAFRIADNRTAENSEWDYKKLGEELASIDKAGDLFQELFTGFDPGEVANILDPPDGTGTSVSTNFDKSYCCPECGHKWSDGDE